MSVSLFVNEKTWSIDIMPRLFVGILYCSLWYCSIVAGYLLLTLPSLLLLLISPPKFCKLGDFVFSFWEVYATVLLDKFGVKIVVSGDHIKYDESAILIMNHRTRVDWNFFWAAMYQACLPKIAAHRLKIVLKDPVRHLPGPGWVMQISGFIYVTRHWEVDQRRLARSLDYVISMKRKHQLLIFPEGTDFTDKSKGRSDKYAEKNGLPKYEYTLHPKTTGFSFLTEHLQKANFLDAVYDMTIGYPDYVPQTEIDIIKGYFPKEVHINIKRVPKSELPTNQADLRTWLEERWVKKEQVLAEFSKTKCFKDEVWPTPDRMPLYVASVFWTALIVISITLLIVSPIFRLVTLLQSLFFIGLSLTNVNFNQLEIGYYRMWLRNAKGRTD